MISLLVYFIISVLYLSISFTISLSVAHADVTKWYKKPVYWALTAPATICGLASTVFAVKLAGRSVFVHVIEWLKK